MRIRTTRRGEVPTALIDGAGALAFVLPALGARQPADAIVAAVDGLLFTGSYSNVEPHHYGGAASAPDTLHDPARDATALPLIRAAIDAGVPVLAICRGMQELNVAYGGTLHQRLHATTGFDDHRERPADPLERQYGPAHVVQFAPGGLLQRVARGAHEATVNSLHDWASRNSARGSSSKPVRPTGWSRPSACAARARSRSACSGIPNGATRSSRCRATSSRHSARRAARA